MLVRYKADADLRVIRLVAFHIASPFSLCIHLCLAISDSAADTVAALVSRISTAASPKT